MIRNISILFLMIVGSLYPQALILISPNGGETYKPGDTVMIRWDGDGSLWPKTVHPDYLYVMTSYSIDSGKTWKSISAGGQLSDKGCAWAIPSYFPQRADCALIKVTQQDIENPVSDVSDKPFTILASSPITDAYEPNDDFSTAYSITLGDSVVRNARIMPSDSARGFQDVDIFKFNCEAGKILTISFLFWPAENGFPFGPTGVWLYDALKNPIDSTAFAAGCWLYRNISQSGTYYCKLASIADGCGRTYGLSVHQGDGTITLFSPNGGETFSPGQEATVHWSASPPNAPSELLYSLDNGRTWLSLNTIQSDSSMYIWTVPQTKRTVIQALFKAAMVTRLGYPHDEIASDTSSAFTVQASPADVYEPNDDFASAKALSLGDSAVKNAMVIGGDTAALDSFVMDEDYYKVTLEAGKLTTFYLFDWITQWPYSTPPEPFIVIYDASKKQIAATNDLSVIRRYLYFTVPQTGVYYCRVSDPFKGYSFKYGLSIYQDDNSVAVLSPNGGEVFTAGQEVTIRIRKAPSIDFIVLDFSDDNGTDASWKSIGITRDSTYTWTVPNIMTNRGKIQVFAAQSANLARDVSDAAFTILMGPPDVYEPNNSFTSAYPIALGDSVVKNAMVMAGADANIESLNIDTVSADVDYFKVSLSAGKLASISAIPWGTDSGGGPTWGSTYPVVTLYDASKNTVSRWTYSLSCNIVKSDVYYIAISPGRTGSWCTYGLSIKSATILSTQKSALDSASLNKSGDSSSIVYIGQIATDTTKLTIALTLNKRVSGAVTTVVWVPDELAFAPNTKAKVKAVSIFASDSTLSSSIKNADITIPYALSDLNGYSEKSLVVFYLDDLANRWTLVNSTIDTVKHQITAQTPGLGTYGVYVKSNTAIGSGKKTISVFGIRAIYQSQKQGIAVHFELPHVTNAYLRLYNVQGKCVRKSLVTVGLGSSSFKWNLGALANGKYSLSIKAGAYHVNEAVLIMN